MGSSQSAVEAELVSAVRSGNVDAVETLSGSRAGKRALFTATASSLNDDHFTLGDHTDTVFSVALSGDGSVAISGSADNSVKVWNLATGRAESTFCHLGIVRCVAISRDGKYGISGSQDKTLRVWDLKTYAVKTFTTSKPILTLLGHTAGVISVAMRWDGKFVISGSDDNTVKVWGGHREELTKPGGCEGTAIQTLVGHKQPVLCVAWSEDGRFAMSGSFDKTIRVWDMKKYTALQTLTDHTRVVCSVAMSRDGRLAMSGSDDDSLKIWNCKSKPCTPIHSLQGRSNGIASVALSADGRVAVTGGNDSTVKVWDLTTQQEILTLAAHSKSVYSVAMSGDGRVAASASNDKTIKVWCLAQPVLHLAAAQGDAAMCKKLLEVGGRELALMTNAVGRRARDVAVLGKHAGVVEVFDEWIRQQAAE